MPAHSRRKWNACPGPTRRELLRVGGLSALGLSLPQVLRARESSPARSASAKNCIVLFLIGGPPQHSTWDPKPDATKEVRGEFEPIQTNVPGITISSLFPQLSRHAEKLCLLRAVATDDNAHSSSGYTMLTGVPHAPLNAEGVNPGPPNDHPYLGAVVRKLRGDRGGLPGAVRLPTHIYNTDNSVWPGQDGGFLGRNSDPWLFRCEPASPSFRIPELTLASDVPLDRLAQRRDLFRQLDRGIATGAESVRGPSTRYTEQAFNLLSSQAARAAFDLGRESPQLRDAYGRSQFGQSCLLARRLVEAGVGLVHVNWFRGPEEPSDSPVWDSHVNETKRLKTVLGPPADRAISALLSDLEDRGLLESTLVMCLAEFGRKNPCKPCALC